MGSEGDLPSFPGKDILAGSAREVLRRFAEGDPLEIQSRCLEHVPKLAVFVDYNRVIRRTMAVAAFGARQYRGEPPLDVWIREMIEKAVSAEALDLASALRDRVGPSSRRLLDAFT
jgi:DNA primase